MRTMSNIPRNTMRTMSKRQHTMSGTPSASGTVPYFDTASSSSSSTPPPSTSKATIKRYSTLPAARQLQNVAIVGAGIAGLSTALSLVRTGGVSASSITIYEPREALDSGQGAGLNLNSGAAILSKEYGINLQRNGINATRAYSTLSAAVIDNSKMMGTDDSTLPNDDDALFDIDLSTRFKHTYLAQNDGSAHVVTMLREDLQSELYSAVSDLGVTILRGPQYFVSGVTDERRIIFKNGNKSNVCYDLVVGADGVRSTVRDMVVEQRRKKRPRYTGIKVAWLITRRTVDDDTDSGLGIVPKGEMRQMVCDGGTVVAYAVSSQFEMIAYLYREPKSKSSSKDINENINYGTNENHKGGKHKNETMDSDSEGYRRERIVKHMMKAKVPPTVWKKFVSPGAGSRFIESAVFDHGLLSHWSRNQVVLVGDAAHAMAPFMGQGANQTIQDAHVLALKLSQHTEVSEALEAYEAVFKREVNAIAKKSRMLGFVLTKSGFTGFLLRKTLQAVSKSTGILEKEMVQAFQPRFV